MSRIPLVESTPPEVQIPPPITTDDLDAFLDGLSDPASPGEVLTGDTVLGRRNSGKPHGAAKELLHNLNPDEFHTLGCCPFRPSAPSPHGKNAIAVVNRERTRLTVMCWAPDEHEHPADVVRVGNDGRSFACWTWAPGKKVSRDVIASDDQSVLADHVLQIMAAKHGLLAVKDEVVYVYDSDGGKTPGDRPGLKGSPTWGSWVPLPATAVLEFVRRALAKLSVRVPAKEEGGEDTARPVRVTVRLVADVATLMLRTLAVRELLYVDGLRKRRAITYDEQEAATSRFDFGAGALLRPGSILTDRGEITLARPDQHVTADSRIGFDPDAQHLGEWEDYVASMVPDATDATALSMWVGAAVVGGCATRLQQHVALLGPAGTGKSQLIELIASIFPTAQRSAVSLAQLSDRFSPAGLVGKRLNISAEADAQDGRLSDIGRLKMILDGSTIQVERKNQQPVWARVTCAHLIGANSLPAGDAGEALYDRFRVVKATTKRIRHEEGAVAQWWTTKLHWRPAILAWAIAGLKQLVQAGWKLPKSAASKEAIEDWRAEGDSVYAWFRALPEPPATDDRKSWAPASAAYAHYTAWCRTNGCGAVKDQRFGRQLKELVGADGWTRSGGRAYRVMILSVDPVVEELSIEEQIRKAWVDQDTDRWVALVKAHPQVGARVMGQVIGQA